MKILTLDLSIKCTGFAVFNNGSLSEFGSIPEQKYPKFSTDRYPKKSGKQGKLMAIKVVELIEQINPDHIVIEEASITGRAGVKSVKSLIQLHGMILDRIEERLDTVSMMAPSGKDGWRTVLQFSKNQYYKKAGGCWKSASVMVANQMFGLNFVLAENDISDACLIGAAYLKLEKK